MRRMGEVRRWIGLVAATGLALWAPTSVVGQSTDGPFAFLMGEWTGSGELMGRPAVFTLTWTPSVDADHARLIFSNAFGTADDPQIILKSEALYAADAAHEVSGSWVDTRGKHLALAGRVDPDAHRLRIEWSDPGVEEGVTVYWREGDRLHVVDSVRTDSGIRGFGRAEYRRAR